ncbi:hypothetical protein [Nonomuraea sp. NPDC002799]
MARARRLAAAGAVTAFVIAGVSLAAGIGTAAAQSGPQVPGSQPTCLLPLPPLCEDDSWSGDAEPHDSLPSEPVDSWSSAPAPTDSWSNAPVPTDSWSNAPVPTDSWSSAPPLPEPERPWRPAGEKEHKVPRGYPETGGGGLAPQEQGWPFALGGAALLTGAGLTGLAVRRRHAGHDIRP